MLRRTVRTVGAISAAAALMLGVSGCAGAPAKPAAAPAVDERGCTPAAGGALVDGLKIDESGSLPETISVPKGASSKSVQARIISGNNSVAGKYAADGDIVISKVAQYDAKTGKQVYAGSDDQPMLVTDSAEQDPLGYSLQCAAVGDRVVVSGGEALGAQAAAQMGGQMPSLIYVFDVQQVLAPAVSGKPSGLPNGFPAVVKDSKQNIGIVFPPTAAPSKTVSAVNIKGTGKKVTDKDALVVRLLAVPWGDSTPSGSGLMPLPAASNGDPVRDELTGKHVGDEVVVLAVVDSNAYAVVVDILGVIQQTQQVVTGQ